MLISSCVRVFNQWSVHKDTATPATTAANPTFANVLGNMALVYLDSATRARVPGFVFLLRQHRRTRLVTTCQQSN